MGRETHLRLAMIQVCVGDFRRRHIGRRNWHPEPFASLSAKSARSAGGNNTRRLQESEAAEMHILYLHFGCGCLCLHQIATPRVKRVVMIAVIAIG